MKNRQFSLFLTTSAIIWVYLHLRAVYVPLVHDEAATFFHYVNHGEWMPGKALFDANNHILNSLLSFYSVKLFGIHEWSLRLANLLFFPVYCAALWGLSGFLKNPVAKWALLIGGLCMHGFTEYFAYSRGYGMSMGILAAALYFGMRYFRQVKTVDLWSATGLFWLATAANLTLMNSTLLFFGAVVLFTFTRNEPLSSKIKNTLPLIAGTPALIPFVLLSMKMKDGGLLYYADGEDFFTAVPVSFSQQFFESGEGFMPWIWVATFGLFLVLTVAVLIKKIKSVPLLVWLFPFMLVGSLTGVFTMHEVLGVNYPSDRTGMYLVLYLFVSLIFLADEVIPKLSAIPAAAFTLHFLFHANLSHSTYWKSEHMPERFWTRVYEDSRSQKMANPTVGGYRIRDLIWSWYNFRHEGPLQNMDYDHYGNPWEDYVIFNPGDYAAHSVEYDSLDFDPISRLTLARRISPLKGEPWYDSTLVSGPEYYYGEYFNLFETENPDSFSDKSWMLETDLKIWSLATPPKIRLVYTMQDEAGNALEYGVSPLHRLRKEFRADQEPVTVKMIWRNVPAQTRRIVVYLWNINGEKYTLETGAVRIKKLNQPG